MAEHETVANGPERQAGDLLRVKLRQARLALGWERLWPALAAPLTVLALFLAVSWFGLWLALPRLGRIAGLLIFAALLAWSLRALFRLRAPSDDVVTARLDRDAGRPHRPVTASTDRLASGRDDPFAEALWQRHQQQARAALERVKVKLPDPQLRRRDPWALRAGILFALFAAAWIAGPERPARLLAAFAVLEPATPPVPTRLDAWIDPPAYTGRPPIFLTRDTSGNDGKGQAKPLAVPANSIMVVRASPPDGIDITVEGALFPKAVEGKPGATAKSADSREQRYTIAGAGAAIVRQHGAILARFPVSSIPDKPPTIQLTAPPARGERDTLRLRYKGGDDYGIASLEAQFAVAPKPDMPPPRTLVPPPSPPLTSPSRSPDAPDTEATLELGEHPWAGTAVRMTLVARDDAGQEGRSDTVDVVIPQRVFSDPLAKALVEQRRDLILDPDHHQPVQIALDALLSAPELFTPAYGTFLALRTASQQLRGARSDPQLLEVADWLWKIALELEDGGLSAAEQTLRQAQERLREAIDRNASADEIRRLTEELRRAMNQYMRELAEKAERDPSRQAEQQDGDERVITQQDLRKLMDEIEKLAREGKQAEAQRLLEQLKRMMENMRVARDRQNTDPRQRQMGEALDELDQMTREQQELRDRTFRNDPQNREQSRPGQRGESRRGQRQGQRGQRGQGQQGQGQQGQGQQGQGEGEDENQTLQDRQQALREQLGRMRERMRQGGLGQQRDLDDAEEAMREAEGALGQGDNGDAVDAQGRALDSLRRNGQRLAEQMGRDGREGQQGQEGPGGNQPFRGRPGDRRYGEGRDLDRDPLGRARRGQLNPDSRFDDKLGLDSSARANRILEELRRRLGQSERPEMELDYLDRLLKRQQ
jgi:uncharacterized protein (TIGR02302 family)